VITLRLSLLIGLLACAVQTGTAQQAGTAQQPAPTQQSGAAQVGAFAPVAHSALVTLEAAGTADGVRLRLRRTQGAEPLAVTELHVSLEGQPTPVTPQADGTWLAPWAKDGGKPAAGLEVVVTHDGIREELSGAMPRPVDQKPAAASGGSGSLLRDHKQMAWWILNVIVVLIAVIAISRRTG
jgi:hypothetical protein